MIDNEDLPREFQEYAETPNGKKIGLYKEANSCLFGVEFKTGGNPPKEFEGSFTTPALAIAQIELYLSRLKAEAKETADKKAHAKKRAAHEKERGLE